MPKAKNNFTSLVALVAVVVIFFGVMVWLMLDLATVGKDPESLNNDTTKTQEVKPDPITLPNYELPVISKRETKLKFIDATKEANFSFQHQAHYTPEKYLPEIMSGGVLVADFNGDGASDLWCINGGKVTLEGQRADDCQDRLFLNDGRGRFTDVSEAWGLQSLATGYGMGGAIGDFDNDGRPDVFLTSWMGGDRLLRNTGEQFVDVTAAAGFGSTSAWGTSAGFFDYDRDGDLDLYVVRYVDYSLANAFRCYVNNIHVYCAPLYTGVPDQLFRNKGDGTFTEVADQAFPAETRKMKADNGIEDLNKNKGLAVGLGDVNADGWPDIYVANDISRNMLYINRQDGTFDEVGREVGVAYGEDGNEQSGMGVAFSDSQGTGRIDIVCTNFQKEPTNLYIQSPQFSFADRSDQKGIGASSRARLSFGTNFFDADNDSDEDLVVANGHIHDNVDVFSSDVTFAQPNSMYEAMGDGKFQDVTTVAGPALQDVQVSRGLATLDFNGDGLVDFVVANNNGSYQLVQNQSTAPGRFIALRLEGQKSNRSGIGAKVSIRLGSRTITRELYGAASYLATNEFIVHVGVGDAAHVDEVRIDWPGSEPQVLPQLETNRYYHVVEGQAARPYVPGKLQEN